MDTGGNVLSSIFTGIPKEKAGDIEWINNVWLPNLMKQRNLTWKDINKRVEKLMGNRLPLTDEEFEKKLISEEKIE